MPAIKGIFFDAAGVFYDRAESTGAFATRRLAALGYANVLSKSDTLRKQMLHTLANEGRISHEMYWEEVLRIYGVDDAAARDQLREQILAHAFDIFAYPGGRQAMAELQARGFILGVITDTIYPLEWKMAWLEKVGVAEFFRVVSCSSTAGAHKPQPEIYQNALQQARLSPPEAAFVGHDAGELEGARHAGLTTVAVQYEQDVRADYYAHNLLALLDVPIFQVAPMTVAPAENEM